MRCVDMRGGGLENGGGQGGTGGEEALGGGGTGIQHGAFSMDDGMMADG